MTELWIFIVTGSISALLLLIAIVLLIKLRKVHNASQEANFLKSHILIGNQRSPNVQTTKIIRTTNSPLQSDEYLFKGDRVQGVSPFNELLKPPRDTVTSEYSSKSYSDLDLPTSEIDGKRVSVISRPKSAVSRGSTSGHESSTEAATIDFSITYKGSTSTLHVFVNSVNNLPLQFRKNCSSYVKVSLKTFGKSHSRSRKTKVVRNSLSPKYDEEIHFPRLEHSELRNYRLKFSTYAKGKTLTKRTLVGDLYVPLSRPDIEPDASVRCIERISLACPVTGKRGPCFMTGQLGFLLVDLEYHCDAGRLKVLIRRAENLPYARRGTLASFGSAEFYAVVSLGVEGDVITYKETRPSVGANPVWNQPFLFYLEEEKMDQYYLQIMVMRGKFYTRDGAVGKVVLGEVGCLSGQAHWAEIFKEDYPEVSKWHEITQMDTSCF